MTEFLHLAGETESLRAVLASIAASPPSGWTVEPPWSDKLLAAILVDRADMLNLRLTLSTGQEVCVQLLITLGSNLTVNHIMAAHGGGGPPLSDEEQTEAMSAVFTECMLPTFESTEGLALVVRRGDEIVTLTHPASPDSSP